MTYHICLQQPQQCFRVRCTCLHCNNYPGLHSLAWICMYLRLRFFSQEKYDEMVYRTGKLIFWQNPHNYMPFISCFFPPNWGTPKLKRTHRKKRSNSPLSHMGSRESDTSLLDRTAVGTGSQWTHVDPGTVGAHRPATTTTLRLASFTSSASGCTHWRGRWRVSSWGRWGWWWWAIGFWWWWAFGCWWWGRSTLGSTVSSWITVARTLDLGTRIWELDIDTLWNFTGCDMDLRDEHIGEGVESPFSTTTTDCSLMAAHVHFTITNSVEPGPVTIFY